jgi:hypothetical protein
MDPWALIRAKWCTPVHTKDRLLGECRRMSSPEKLLPGIKAGGPTAIILQTPPRETPSDSHTDSDKKSNQGRVIPSPSARAAASAAAFAAKQPSSTPRTPTADGRRRLHSEIAAAAAFQPAATVHAPLRAASSGGRPSPAAPHRRWSVAGAAAAARAAGHLTPEKPPPPPSNGPLGRDPSRAPAAAETEAAPVPVEGTAPTAVAPLSAAAAVEAGIAGLRALVLQVPLTPASRPPSVATPI